MPSLRKRVSTYLRQLSFHNEPREKKNNVNENAFVTKYLQGQIAPQEGPSIIYGKSPTDLPNYELAKYESGSNTVVGCYSGPSGGLTTVKRTEKHLSVPDDDIDFIDNPEAEEPIPQPMPKISPKRVSGQPIDNTTMVIKVAGNEYCVTNKPKRHSKSFSLGSISDFSVEVEKTKIDKDFYNCDNKKDKNSNNHDSQCGKNQNKCDTNGMQEASCEGTITTAVKSEVTITNSGTNNNTKSEPVEASSYFKQNNEKVNPKTFVTSQIPPTHQSSSRSFHSSKLIPNTSTEPNKNYALAKSRSEGHPFNNKKRGKVIQVKRQHSHRDNDAMENQHFAIDDTSLPPEWTRKSDCFYGVSDSLYDRNQVTKQKNGDPIADCFGIIARNDSAILAVADGVNWGEKASIAAKSAIHASLHYLNKTIFNDTKPFEKLTVKTDDVSLSSDSVNLDEVGNLIANTREVFVCLLRAFNCAHDLILENQGMLTTLTVAVILPLNETQSHRNENGMKSTNRTSHYVCCVCNVGDTLAYVYSQRNGIRELTKGSHDVNSNRDMRDALGALGPVDGINPELSNLTLSITTLNEGDIVLVASDGLTDNFDPNVCKFTVNSKVDVTKNRVQKTYSGVVAGHLVSSQSQSNAKLPEQKSQLPTVHSQRVEGPITQKPPVKPPRRSKNRGSVSSASQSERSASSVEKENVQGSDAPYQSYVNPKLDAVKAKELSDLNHPLIAHFVKENSPDEHKATKTEVKKQRSVIDNKASSLRKQVSTQHRTDIDRKLTPPLKANPNTLDSSKQKNQTHKFLKSKTSLDLRSSHHNKIQIARNVDGIPFVTPFQRYELQLLLMEDILRNGISGKDSPITTAKRLCENLVNFTMSITSAKRRTLEDQDMYFDHRNGVLVEVTNQEKKLRRKKGLEKVQSLPGKLDHVTVVAYNVGNVAF